MNNTAHPFRFLHTLGALVLECRAEYWTTQYGPLDAELLDVTHKGQSILEIMDLLMVQRIEEEVYSKAKNEWESEQAAAQDLRRAA